jgi:RNA polymerase sigma factor (sigma-70 family)
MNTSGSRKERGGEDLENERFRQLYRQYGREIYGYLYSLCQNRALAEDLRQETFLKAFLSLPSNHANMRAWLYLVARNLFYNAKKRERRQESWQNEQQEAARTCGDPWDGVWQNERKRVLYEALARLPLPKREVLVMQYLGNMSQKEIAAILKLTPEHVRVLSYRARKELRAYMEENGYDIS